MHTLRLAANHHGVGIDELDGEVLMLDARQLSLQLECGGDLAYVEAGREEVLAVAVAP